MSFIDVNLNDTKEPEAVEAGQYEVRVIKAEAKDSNAGNPMIAIQYEILNQPDASLVFETIMLPKADDDDRMKNLKKLSLKRLCAALDYEPAGGIDTDELVGRECSVLLKSETSEQYGTQNRVSRYITS